MKTNVDTKIEMDLSSKTSVYEELNMILSILFREVEAIIRKPEIKRYKKSVGCKVDVELHARIRDCAWRNKESVSMMLTRFIKEGLDKELSTVQEP